MKLLCPTDFSKTSVHACRWAAKFLDHLGGGQLEVIHCLNVVSRSALFIKVDDIFLDQAKQDLRELATKLQAMAPSVNIHIKVVKANPKDFLPSYVKSKVYDLLVLGTKGMSALKEMTIGSVTAFLMDRISIPLLAIPEGTAFRPIQSLVLGIGDQPVPAPTYRPLIDLIKETKAQLEVVHTNKIEKIPFDYQLPFEIPLEDIQYQFTTLFQGKSIPQTLSNYSESRKADILVMVHRKRKWISRIFVNSLSKEELFVIKTPLLILPELEEVMA